jgi:membrane associated rhomboid family serine protease
MVVPKHSDVALEHDMTYAGPRFAFPPLTSAVRMLLVANAAVFLVNALLVGRLSDAAAAGSGFWFACSWQGLWEGWGLGLVRLCTYQFTHSFRDPMHLLFNMLMLYFAGTMAEARLGFGGLLRLYLWGGVVGAALHLAIASVQGDANVPLVGASGACYALLLYAACTEPHRQVIAVFVQVPLWGVAAVLVLLGVYSTFVEFATGFSGGVSHGAHLGGAALGWFAWRRGLWSHLGYASTGARPGWFAALLQRWRRRQAERAQAFAKEHELQLDEILAKVKHDGLSALSAAERRFLERASQKARDGDL